MWPHIKSIKHSYVLKFEFVQLIQLIQVLLNELIVAHLGPLLDPLKSIEPVESIESIGFNSSLTEV